ncbi:hypothetical protein MJO29_012877 [Puccinia striiformis f. sp. tritici]|nr:hypothetical protein MJO29_012877 [Puccinia striiformis f. sp. tritici]
MQLTKTIQSRRWKREAYQASCQAKLNPAWNGSFNNTELDPPNVQNSIFLVYQLVKDGVMKTVTGQAHHNSISQSVQEAPNNLSVSPSGYEPEFNSLRNSFDMTQSDTGTGTLRQSEG